MKRTLSVATLLCLIQMVAALPWLSRIDPEAFGNLLRRWTTYAFAVGGLLLPALFSFTPEAVAEAEAGPEIVAVRLQRGSVLDRGTPRRGKRRRRGSRSSPLQYRVDFVAAWASSVREGLRASSVRGEVRRPEAAGC